MKSVWLRQWRIQKFQNQGAWSRRGINSLGLGIVLINAPQRIPYAFVVRVENRIHTVHVAY